MLTPEKFMQQLGMEDSSVCVPNLLTNMKLSNLLIGFKNKLIQSIIDDLEANRNKNAVEYLKSKL